MEREVRVVTLTNSVYWVTDNRGVRHLYHDHLAAQCAEDRYAREARENAENTGVSGVLS